MNLNPRSALSEIYWSRFGAPIRALWPKPPRPAWDAPHWDAQVSGAFAPRLGGTLSVGLRNRMVASLLEHGAGCRWQSVLDLGCAGATLASELKKIGARRYVGVDISRVACEAARRQRSLDLRDGIFQSSVESFTTDEKFDLIVFAEVLYYLDFNQVVPQLRRYAAMLQPGGTFCISLNLQNPKGRAINRELARHLDFISGFHYQEKTHLDGKIVPNRERPPYHTFLAWLK